MARILVRLRPEDLQADDVGSRVRVALLDTTEADALHDTVAEAVGVVGPDGDILEADLDIPDGALDDRRRYSWWAHVDRSGSGDIGTGDLIVTQNIPVAADAVASAGPPVVLPLTRV